MKLIYFIVCISLLFLVSCNSQKWEEKKQLSTIPVSNNINKEKIFSDNMYCIHTRFYSSPMEFGWKSRNQLVDNQLSME